MATKKMTAKKTTRKTAQPFVIVRGRNSGVHAGYLVEHRATDGVVVLRDARRIWSWSGAASLSELAVYGARNSAQCRFGVRIARQEIIGSDACELIHTRPTGQKMIESQPEWRA
jgi:hypothetical protein